MALSFFSHHLTPLSFLHYFPALLTFWLQLICNPSPSPLGAAGWDIDSDHIFWQLKESIGSCGEMLWVTHHASKYSLVVHGWFSFIFPIELKHNTKCISVNILHFEKQPDALWESWRKTNYSANYWLKRNFYKLNNQGLSFTQRQ